MKYLDNVTISSVPVRTERTKPLSKQAAARAPSVKREVKEKDQEARQVSRVGMRQVLTWPSRTPSAARASARPEGLVA